MLVLIMTIMTIVQYPSKTHCSVPTLGYYMYMYYQQFLRSLQIHYIERFHCNRFVVRVVGLLIYNWIPQMYFQDIIVRYLFWNFMLLYYHLLEDIGRVVDSASRYVIMKKPVNVISCYKAKKVIILLLH